MAMVLECKKPTGEEQNILWLNLDGSEARSVDLHGCSVLRAMDELPEGAQSFPHKGALSPFIDRERLQEQKNRQFANKANHVDAGKASPLAVCLSINVPDKYR